MRRLSRLFLRTCCALLLAACTARSSMPATPTAAAPVSPFDGEWKGQGRTADGRLFDVSFIVQGGVLQHVIYTFKGLEDAGCIGIEYAQTPEEQRPHIRGNAVSAPLESNFSITASFSSDSAVSGHFTAYWHNRKPRCNGEYEVDWSATKTAAVTAPSPSNAPLVPAHPLATFFQILIFGLSNGSVLALNAIGVTIIYSTVRTLNLAHGDVFALTTALVTSIVNAMGIRQDWPPLELALALVLVLFAAILLAALLSMGVDQLGFKPFRGSSRLAPLIATLGLSFILFQAALVWRTFQASWIPGEHRSVPGLPEVPTDGIPNLLPEINVAARLGIPNIVIRFSDVFVLLMALVFVLLATWFLRRTHTGHAIQALAQNPQLAQIVGVNVDGTIRRAFAVGGAFAGAAAFIFALYYSRPFGAHGAQSGLLAFAAALVGGIGSPVGALLSGLSIGVFSSLSDYYFSAGWTPVLLLAFLVGLLAWRPTGLASSEDEPTATSQVRDSVILSAASVGSHSRRWLLVFLALLAAFPLLASAFGWSGQVILGLAEIFILLTLGLNLALGMTGLLDFGFAASFGLGAYAGMLFSRYDAVVALLIGIVLAGLLGLLKGGLARRLRGDFLAIATLALGLLVQQLTINLPDLTGGPGGKASFAALHFAGLRLADPTLKFYFVFAFVVLAAIGSERLLHSRTGRSWVASSEDESAALASGVDVGRARLLALVVSSALAGLAGVLYAGTLSYVDPETMSFHITSLILTMVILGGAGNVPGVLVGAAAIVLYDKLFVPRLADLLALIWPRGLAIGSAPDIRGASFFNFGIILYLTVLLRARRRS